jgi:hypothetical protein
MEWNHKKFRMWTENGKYYFKPSQFAKKQEISQEKFKEILAEETIISIGITQNQSLGIAELLQHYQTHYEEKTSEFGRRISVDLLEEKQTESKEGGVDVHFKLDILDEKTGQTADDLFPITANIKGVTGPMTERGIYYPELFRAIYQLAFNGYLSNDEEISKGKEALEKDIRKSL